MPICAYCGKEKAEDELTQEHVIPKAIGGNLLPTNPFLLNSVCKRCNNVAGTYIDGPFIKNWLVQNSKTENIYKYADISKNPILPLRYMGPCNELSYEDKICELWLGPAGDTIYHFHLQYPDEPDISPMVGVPTYARRDEIDYGFAFLFISSNNPVWHPTIVLSFSEYFKKSIIYLGNGPTPKGGRFSKIPIELEFLHKKLRSMGGKQHEISLKMRIDYGDRFMAKVALGIGCLLLNSSFIKSESADLLRQFMWTKDAKEREKIPVLGSRFLDKRSDLLKKILCWPEGHFIALIESEDSLYLFTSFYGNQNSAIKISSEPEHWKDIISREGIAYVIAPGLQKYVGNKDIATFIAHKIDPEYLDQDLNNLEIEMNKFSILPPFRI